MGTYVKLLDVGQSLLDALGLAGVFEEGEAGRLVAPRVIQVLRVRKRRRVLVLAHLSIVVLLAVCVLLLVVRGPFNERQLFDAVLLRV